MAITPPTIIGTPSIGNSQAPLLGNQLTLAGHVVPSGSTVLYVVTGSDNFPQQIPTVTWNSAPLVRVAMDSWAQGLQLFALYDPPPGVGDVVISVNPLVSQTIAGVAFNIANFGHLHMAEVSWWFSFDPVSERLVGGIYAGATDLVLSIIQVYTGNTAIPDPGQTMLANNVGGARGAQFGGCQFAMSQVAAPVDTGVPAVEANITRIGWTTDVQGFNSGNAQMLLAIRGLDTAPPSGAPSCIGRLTEIMSIGREPPVSLAKWRHQVPADFRTLVFLGTLANNVITGIFWQPDGGAEVGLVRLSEENGSYVWLLEQAPVGTGWMRIEKAGLGAHAGAAFSLSALDLVGDCDDVFGGITIASAPGKVVLDRAGVGPTGVFFTLTPVGAALLYSQALTGAIDGGANNRQSPTVSMPGGSSWKIAVGPTTQMPWNVAVKQGVVCFTCVEPPPPECPGTRGEPPIDGLPYVPPVFPPCEGSGQRGDPPIGA